MINYLLTITYQPCTNYAPITHESCIDYAQSCIDRASHAQITRQSRSDHFLITHRSNHQSYTHSQTHHQHSRFNPKK